MCGRDPGGSGASATLFAARQGRPNSVIEGGAVSSVESDCVGIAYPLIGPAVGGSPKTGKRAGSRKA